MSCTFDRNLIQDYLDDLLTEEERSQVEAHIADCPDCHQEWVEMSNLKELLRDTPVAELPEGFKEELHDKLVETYIEKQTPKPLRMEGLKAHFKKYFKAYGGVAAVLVVAIVAKGMMQNGDIKLTLSNSEVGPEHVEGIRYGGGLDETIDAIEKEHQNFEDQPIGRIGNQEGAEPTPSTENAKSYSASDSTKSTEMDLQITTGNSGVPAKKTDANAVPASPLQKRKVIVTGNADIRVVNFDKVIDNITQSVTAMGGYVESMNVADQYQPVPGEKALKEGHITLRIPQGQFQSYFKSLEALGRVINQSINSEDISNVYRDTSNEVANLEVREQKLREIMAQAKTVQETLAVEGELSRVRGQINSLKGTLQQWDNLVSLTTVTLNITEVRSLEGQVAHIDEDLATRAWKNFTQSLNNLVSGTENLAVKLAGSIPWIIVWVIGLSVAFVVARLTGVIKKRKPKDKTQNISKE